MGLADDIIKEEESMDADSVQDPLELYRYFYQQGLHNPGLQAIRYIHTHIHTYTHTYIHKWLAHNY